jgi:hypothetical protein
LERDALLALWQDGVPLGHAWEVFADEWSATSYRELQRTDSHLGLKRLLKLDLRARLYAGELKAIGIEGASDAGPILIPQYYFSKTAKVDRENGIVSALGKIFYEVRIIWEREPPDETRQLKPVQWIHPRELEAQWELGPPCEPEPFPGEQWQLEELDETLLIEPESSNQAEQEAAEEAPTSEPTPAKFGEAPLPLDVGRPSKGPEIERAMDILLERGVELGKICRPDAIAAIRECAANELNSNMKIGFHKSVIQSYLFRRFGPRR